jgi:O-acetyl-ADP-ribose deacetylase (regulator of RNase III)
VWRGGAAGEPRLLGACYAESLRLARQNQIETLAFPAISTGVYGYPMDAATKIAVREVGAWLVANDVPVRVTFCCFRDSDADVYRRTVETFLGSR